MIAYKNKLSINITIPFLSTLITLLLIEIGFRLYGYDPLKFYYDNNQKLPLQESLYPDIKYEMTPNFIGHIWDTDVKLNSIGFRGEGPSFNPKPDYRIIVLGDSVVFGLCVPLEATFPYQLQQLLKDEEKKYEVLNFGVNGYDTLQEIAVLKYKGLQYKPDLVVVGFCLNDVGVTSINIKYIEDLKKYQENILFKFRLVQFLTSKSDRAKLQEWLNLKNEPNVFLQDYQGQIAPIDNSENELFNLMNQLPNLYPSFWYKHIEKIGRLRFAFRQLSQISKNNNIPILILIIPWLETQEGEYPHKIAHRIVELEATKAGLEVIDLAETFIKTGIESLKIKKYDNIHPNQKGHALIAEKLANYILNK